MRKLLLSAVAPLALLVAGFSSSFAADEKEVTVVGEGVCAKCALKEKPSCQNVVIVKEDGKETKYFLADNKVSKDYHKSSGICAAKTDKPVKTKVTGTVVEKDGVKELTATKIEKAD